jgi:CubicO group peptidase (beta-lactamase class C family)
MTFKKYKTSGGMVLAAKDGEIVYRQCYGWANKKADEKVTPETYFKLASVAKLVTALPVMKLVEDGRLDLDENIGHILGNPAFEAASAKYPKKGITSRMLMTHTAAINDSKGMFMKGKNLTEALNPKKNKTGSGFLDRQPGTYYKYSNYGAGILGCILEAVTGERLTDAARELVFDAMGIEAAYDPHLLQDPEKIVSTYRANGNLHITRSYRLKQAYRETVNLDKDYNESYGGVWIRGEDLVKIGIMLCNYGEIDGKQILQEETVREMLSSQNGKGGITEDSPYGLNIERVTNLVSGKTVYGHQGMAEGVLCSLYFDPETKFVFALLTNGCNVNAKEDHICTLSRKLFEIMWNTYAK